MATCIAAAAYDLLLLETDGFILLKHRSESLHFPVELLHKMQLVLYTAISGEKTEEMTSWMCGCLASDLSKLGLHCYSCCCCYIWRYVTPADCEFCV